MRRQSGLVLLALALVALAFVRAQYFSSTGIRIAGDGADYAQLAAGLELEGRAPFVYRPAVPFLVGALFPGNLELGFAIVCAIAMFLVFVLVGARVPDRVVGAGLVVLLFLNYQVLFAAANPARLDMVVLAIQSVFVTLALRGNARLFFLLLPFMAPVKETLVLGLGALVFVAFPRQRETFARSGLSAAAFVAIHLVVRWLARPLDAMPPYSEGLSPAALSDMLASNLTPLMPLHFFVAWGGLCFIALHCLFGKRRDETWSPIEETARAPAGAASTNRLLVGAGGLLILFPMPLATDLHRAWFELLAPVVLYSVLAALRTMGAPGSTHATSFLSPTHVRARWAFGAALVAALIPYGTGAIAPQHLYLLILQDRLTPVAAAALGLALASAATALTWWMKVVRDHPAPPLSDRSPD